MPVNPAVAYSNWLEKAGATTVKGKSLLVLLIMKALLIVSVLYTNSCTEEPGTEELGLQSAKT